MQQPVLRDSTKSFLVLAVQQEPSGTLGREQHHFPGSGGIPTQPSFPDLALRLPDAGNHVHETDHRGAAHFRRRSGVELYQPEEHYQMMEAGGDAHLTESGAEVFFAEDVREDISI